MESAAPAASTANSNAQTGSMQDQMAAMQRALDGFMAREVARDAAVKAQQELHQQQTEQMNLIVQQQQAHNARLQKELDEIRVSNGGDGNDDAMEEAGNSQDISSNEEQPAYLQGMSKEHADELCAALNEVLEHGGVILNKEVVNSIPAKYRWRSLIPAPPEIPVGRAPTAEELIAIKRANEEYGIDYKSLIPEVKMHFQFNFDASVQQIERRSTNNMVTIICYKDLIKMLK